MAKLYGTFKDVNNNTVTVYIISDKIQTDTIIGNDDESEIQFTWDSPVIITDEANDTRQHIRPKSCTINLLTKTYLGDELYSSKDIDTSVTVYVGGECKFAGFLTPNVYSQSYAKIWERLTLNAIDYLSILEYVRPTDSETYEDLKRDADVYSMKKYLQDFVFNNVDLLNRDNEGLSHVYYDLSKQISADSGSTQPSNVTQWTSSDTSVATVDSGGNVYAVGPGTCTITGTCMYDSTQLVEYDVNVTWPMNYIVIKNVPEPNQTNKGIGDVLTVVEYDRVPVTNTELYPDLQWVSTTITSSDENVLSVEITGPTDARRGIIYIENYGTATVTVNDNYTYTQNGRTVEAVLQSDSFTCYVSNEISTFEITGLQDTDNLNVKNILYTCGTNVNAADVAVSFSVADENCARIVNNQLVIHNTGTVHIIGHVVSKPELNDTFNTSVTYYPEYEQCIITGEAQQPFDITINGTSIHVTPNVNTHKFTIQYDNVYGSSLNEFFSGCDKITLIDSFNGYTGDIESARGMFRNCNNLTAWYNLPDLSNVSDVSEMFRNCTALTDVEELELTNPLINMDNMFNGCTNVDNIVFSGLKPVSCNNMFAGCDNLRTVTLYGSDDATFTMIMNSLKQSFPTKNITHEEGDDWITIS